MQMLILREGLFQEQVLPAADQQHGNLGALKGVVELQPGPERVVVLRVLQPGLEPRRAGAEQRSRGVAGRHSCRCARQQAFGPQLPGEHADPARIFLVGDHVAPAQEVVEPECARAPAGSGQVVRADGYHSSLHLRRRIGQHRPLGEAEVRPPDRAEGTGEPRLLAQPCRGVGAIGDLVDHRIEFAAGAEGAANALQDDVVAARRVGACEQRRKRIPAAVGAADQQRARRIRRRWLVVVGDQLDAVAHRDAHAVVHGVVRRVRWQMQHAADRAAGVALDTRTGWRRGGCGRYGGHLTKATHAPRVRKRSRAKARGPAADWCACSRRRRGSRSVSRRSPAE